mmetsp:Transcript_27157/g.45297  ORF Transcript_27157/g.45297 Transcript_27157/m.45297 type:complete len:332 (+) Transcript_27157:661-1656(+)
MRTSDGEEIDGHHPAGILEDLGSLRILNLRDSWEVTAWRSWRTEKLLREGHARVGSSRRGDNFKRDATTTVPSIGGKRTELGGKVITQSFSVLVADLAGREDSSGTSRTGENGDTGDGLLNFSCHGGEIQTDGGWIKLNHKPTSFFTWRLVGDILPFHGSMVNALTEWVDDGGEGSDRIVLAGGKRQGSRIKDPSLVRWPCKAMVNSLGLDTHGLNLWIELEEAATALLLDVFGGKDILVRADARSVHHLLNCGVVKTHGSFVVETGAITVVAVLDTLNLGSYNESSLNIKHVVMGGRPITTNAVIFNDTIAVVFAGLVVVCIVSQPLLAQ